MMTIESATAAACCAEFYEQDWVRALLGDRFHPGGAALTQRLIDDLALAPGDRVLDLACGTGGTARQLLDGWDVQVVGLDFSAANLDRARTLLADQPSASFVQGSADALPFDDRSFQAVICECAVSTFADKPKVASEITRVLADGGRFAMSDMAVYQALPPELAAFGRGWACVDDALTVEGYRELFESAGLLPQLRVDESAALDEMVLDLKKKLLMAGLGELSGILEGSGQDLATLRALLAEAKAAVKQGHVRYTRLGFSQGKPRATAASARRPTPAACDPTTGCC